MRFSFTSVTVRPEHCDPFYLLRRLGDGLEYCALLETGQWKQENDYSFLALGARDVMVVRNGLVSGSRYVPAGRVPDALSALRQAVALGDEGKRLQMGYIGFLSYEAARQFDDIALDPDPATPDALFVLPELMLRIDHANREVMIIAHGDSTEDLADIVRVVEASPFSDDTAGKVEAELPLPLLTADEVEPFRTVSHADYCAGVEKVRQKILAGEVFQVQLSQEFVLADNVPSEMVYRQLRRVNPSPYMYYFRTPELTLVGASPETLVRVDGRNILYRPIAGTRKRTGDEAVDRAMREELVNDEKERCEHQMLVDLGRNDVGRVAETGSVAVRRPFRIEQYAHVYHIVSDIVGRAKADLTALEVVRSVFPAGTLTGAPKLRAMEIIRDLESSPRGVYGGAFGYVDLGGNVDFAIIIRTLLFRAGEIRLRAAAGVVKDSVAEHEDKECLYKARSCLAAVELARREAGLS